MVHRHNDIMDVSANKKRMRHPDAYTVIIAFLLFFVIGRWLLLVVVTTGDSMYPNYCNGDIVIMTRIHGEYQRGDVIVFDSSDEAGGKKLLKRIVALPGDRVEMDVETGELWVNGSSVIPSGGQTISREEIASFPIDEIPAGYLFVLGDNYEVSHDSRYYDIGLVSFDSVDGVEIIHFKNGERTS